jgi:hypothetical protein
MRLDRMRWFGGAKNAKPGVKGWRHSRLFKTVRHQGAKALRAISKKLCKESISDNDIDFPTCKYTRNH